MRKFYDMELGGGGGWEPIFGEWQLCPKCFGEGVLEGVFYTDQTTNFSTIKTCDVCQGAKLLQKPIINLPQLTSD